MPNIYSAEREAALDLARPPKAVKFSETEERRHCPHQLDQLGQEENQMLHHLSEFPFHPYENLLWHVGQHAAALDDARGNNNGESFIDLCLFSDVNFHAGPLKRVSRSGFCRYCGSGDLSTLTVSHLEYVHTVSSLSCPFLPSQRPLPSARTLSARCTVSHAVSGHLPLVLLQTLSSIGRT